MSTKDEVTLKRSSRFQILRRLAKYGEPDRGRIFIGLLGLAVNSVTNLTFPWVLGQAIDQDSALVASDRPFFIFKAAGIFLLGSIASWVRVYCLGTATDRITARIRKQLFDCYMDMKNMEFFDTTRCGEIVSVLENDVGKAATALTDKLAAGLRSINASINGSIFLFVSSPQLSSVSLGIVPFVGVAAMTLSKYSRKLADKLRRIEADTLSFVLERIVGIKSVRLNGREVGCAFLEIKQCCTLPTSSLLYSFYRVNFRQRKKCLTQRKLTKVWSKAQKAISRKGHS
jgi:ABC-type multidrug transport system fused ATPase/permease subunit